MLSGVCHDSTTDLARPHPPWESAACSQISWILITYATIYIAHSYVRQFGTHSFFFFFWYNFVWGFTKKKKKERSYCSSAGRRLFFIFYSWAGKVLYHTNKWTSTVSFNLSCNATIHYYCRIQTLLICTCTGSETALNYNAILQIWTEMQNKQIIVQFWVSWFFGWGNNDMRL